MTIVPLFGRIALHGTGHEDEIFRFLVPMMVGGVAGFLIGLAKDRVQTSLAQCRSILDAMPYGVVQCNSSGQLLFANQKICDILGCSKDELLGSHLWKFCSSDLCRSSLQTSFAQLVESGRLTQAVSGSFNSKTGEKSKVEFHWNHQGHFDASLGCHAYTATIINVTSQVKSQRLLEKLSQVVEHADELILLTDRNGIIEYVNPALERVSGYSAQELMGKKPSMLKSSAQDASVYQQLWQTIVSGQTWRGTLIDRRKDGSFYPVAMTVSPILNDQGEIAAYVSVQQDMTERQELEEQLLQSQKMEALGTLVGGIAHDFNNILAAVKGHTYLARGEMDDQKRCAERLSSVDALTDQGSEMIQQLLTFARKDQLEKRIFSLNKFMRDGYRLAKSIIPENIVHETDFCDDELFIYGNATQFQQVMMNLVGNACDAVANVQKPKTRCTLSRFYANDIFRKRHPDLQGDHFARISVSDNGVGIDPEQASKIFEPFYTTKGVGEGTGLGLAMVYGAVSGHGGVIEAGADEGWSTTFSIYLPLSESEGQRDVLEEHVSTAASIGGLILLVDDEASLRHTLREVLESHGYQVIEAGDGEEALQLFQSRAKEIALIITDIVMPKMGGIDFIDAVRAIDQNMPAIYISGYEGGAEQRRLLAEDTQQSCVMNKPFQISALAAAVGEMIAARDG
ncbi:PAS domain-containing sensor histidine kinase [Mariprofundus sp. KV]|uniref:PAS domain-containing hybrid sensor histidine kinase/response regulator n=1 Tax=Mariprofundus sp. KV TaxID=2608715 RepID=UPI0015A25519|nr:PAS domain-containing sensor histidine kinase [Mariprofundus sp. KV]